MLKKTDLLEVELEVISETIRLALHLNGGEVAKRHEGIE